MSESGRSRVKVFSLVVAKTLRRRGVRVIECCSRSLCLEWKEFGDFVDNPFRFDPILSFPHSSSSNKFESR